MSLHCLSYKCRIDFLPSNSGCTTFLFHFLDVLSLVVLYYFLIFTYTLRFPRHPMPGRTHLRNGDHEGLKKSRMASKT